MDAFVLIEALGSIKIHQQAQVGALPVWRTSSTGEVSSLAPSTSSSGSHTQSGLVQRPPCRSDRVIVSTVLDDADCITQPHKFFNNLIRQPNAAQGLIFRSCFGRVTPISTRIQSSSS